MTVSDPVSESSSAAPDRKVELGRDRPIRLDCGVEIGPITVAYQTYGRLNADKSNAILICHALTGDHYVADPHPITGKPGWWSELVGPGRLFDTDRYFLICSNVLGGCMGTTGPMEINPATGQPWGLGFPVITIGDMVQVQARLIDHLGIGQLFCVVGGSMGGMQVLEWAQSYPDRVFSAIPIAAAARHSAQNIAFHEVGRQAIVADPDWCDGNYLLEGKRPHRGLAVARMAAHITYLSEPALHQKFGRNLQNREAVAYGFDADFQVESYLRHQGSTFVDRFDANSYLYITRAMDYFDLAAENGGVLANAFRGTRTRFCVVSFTSDWLFPTAESRAVVHALNAVAANVSFVEIRSDKGHDAFLLDEPEFHATLTGFLNGAAAHRGLPGRGGASQ
ncbi:homoserine O-acetyltransferase [Paramagnetospirillum kuznetsovii]|uniref:Homoserine O-acetyltransferase n=1 Tax=Paramagnetospirillum kuznetsovii TaxID=2053833 RepID=A0A364P154_9PROT|nr:homoserine O-acetyltransferase [Paramagnetospirillum kuznetsovii]RAU23026.1 homoserine O-acetyltransferase [Paramagnetospirillum kuznetsovii]